MVQIVPLVALTVLLAGEACAALKTEVSTAPATATASTTRRTPPLGANRTRLKESEAISTGRSSGDPAKPKLMVVFARKASEGEESRTQPQPARTMLLFDDAQVDRRSDVPDEPSAELLPPLEGRLEGEEHVHEQVDLSYTRRPRPATGYDYLKPQQDDPKPSAGYDYPKPQQDDPRPSPGYHYPKPQQDSPKPSTGYTYPAPQQDVMKPWTGYQYPKPQQDETQPSTGYNYPNPRPDDSATGVGYNYPIPQQDPQRPAKLPSSGYLHPIVHGADQPTSTWRPVALTPEQDYLPPAGQLPLEDPAPPRTVYGAPAWSDRPTTKPPLEDPAPPRPVYGAPAWSDRPTTKPPLEDPAPPRPVYGAPAWSDRPTTKLQDFTPSAGTSPRPQYLADSKPTGHPSLQDELPFSHGQDTWPLANAYLPPSPQYDSPHRDDYTPTQPPLRDDVPTNGYLPPKQTLRDEAPTSSYIPPKQPARDDPLASNYLPPKQPLRDDPLTDSYLPPKQHLSDDSYLPPKHHEPLDVYGPTKTTGQAFDKEDDFFKSVQAQPRHLAAALRAGTVDEHGIRVTDMSCLRTAHRARFTATITSPRFLAWPPVLEAVPGSGAVPTDCRIIADPADPHHRFLVDLSNPDLTRCGVKGCSADGEPRLCSRLLMPSLPGLRLASDPVLLLQCALQPASVSLLQQARLAAAQPASARSAGVVHAGGERAPLHVQLQLYRRGAAGDFSRAMQQGGAVHLGDELQLRATVRRGDGWQSSRLSDVVVRRGSDAVHLVGADGCSNPEMRAVCPRDQAWLAGEPLASLLTMRVFMFRGMQDGDQLLLTARVVACLDRADCKLSVETCEAAARHARTKRSSGSLNATFVSLEESVSFVVRRGSEEEDATKPTRRGADAPLQRNILTAAVLLSATLLPSTVLLLYWCKHRKVIVR